MGLRVSMIDVLTFLVGVCIVIATTIAVLSWQSGRSAQLRFEMREVPDWHRFADVGHKLGPESAILTIVEWGDYECPPCAYFEDTVRSLEEKYPGAIMRVYRHWPLTNHRYAYPAARAAECAAAQGRFPAYHRLLFENSNWLGDAFERFAETAGVPDLKAFRDCIARTEPVPAIERDIEAVRELDAFGTPALIINGTYHPDVPDGEELSRLVEDLLEERSVKR